MKNIMMILTGLIILCNCDTKSHQARADNDDDYAYQLSKNYIINNVRYMKDPRTDLCFAASPLGSSISIFATVPCTEKVLQLIK